MCVDAELKAQLVSFADRQSLQQKENQDKEHPRQALHQWSTKYAAVSSMLHPHPAHPPPHGFASLRRDLALASPRHKGHAFAEL